MKTTDTLGTCPIKIDAETVFEVDHERSRLRVGSRIWYYDNCRRVYIDDEGNGVSKCHPSAFWVEREIIDETRVSWLVGHVGEKPSQHHRSTCMKIQKRNPGSNRRFCFSMLEVRLRLWRDANHYAIASRLDRLDVGRLASVAAMIDYPKMSLPRYVSSDDLHKAEAERRPRQP